VDDIDWLIQPAAATRRKAQMAERKAAEYLQKRMLRLQDQVATRIEDLEERELELAAEERDSRAALREIREQLGERDAFLWPDQGSTMPAELGQIEQRARRMRIKQVQLHDERATLREQLDTASARLEELQHADTALGRGGTRALRRMVARRQFSRPLQAYLSRLTGDIV